MSFIERSNVLCPLFGVSFKRGSTVYFVGGFARRIVSVCLFKFKIRTDINFINVFFSNHCETVGWSTK